MIDPDPMKTINSAKGGLAVMLIVAVAGGVARQAHQILSGKKVTVYQFGLRAFISTFIGLVCYFALPPATAWSFATTGLMSWLGADGVALLLQIFFQKRDK
jgi:hypothetical protein